MLGRTSGIENIGGTASLQPQQCSSFSRGLKCQTGLCWKHKEYWRSHQLTVCWRSSHLPSQEQYWLFEQAPTTEADLIHVPGGTSYLKLLIVNDQQFRCRRKQREWTALFTCIQEVLSLQSFFVLRQWHELVVMLVLILHDTFSGIVISRYTEPLPYRTSGCTERFYMVTVQFCLVTEPLLYRTSGYTELFSRAPMGSV